ncbi:MAG: hypothetical protein M0038_09985 [Pseudomonadota bacterium]|jgi:hypothetical protein|nr:hypothetical protein [Pseudomonadota bacterium]
MMIEIIAAALAVPPCIEASTDLLVRWRAHRHGPCYAADMAGESDNLVLEMLRAIRAKQDRHDERFDELMQRLGRIEASIVGLRRDSAHAEETQVEQEARMDRLARRIERIEKRLELTDQP